MSGDPVGDCTSIMRLDLKQLAKRINIGREEYWGDTSTVWVSLFYVHCVVFIILFTIIICWCVLFLWEKLKSWRRQSSFLYLLCVYCFMWSFTSLVYYILLAVDVSHPPNQKQTTATYSFEMIAVASSMNGILIIAVYQYYRLRFHSYQSLKKYVLLTVLSVIIAATVITMISIPVNHKAVVVIVVLVLVLTFIGMMGTTALVAMYTELWFRAKSSRSLQGSIAGRFLIQRLIFRLISYIYLVIVPVHLLTPFVKLVIESDCVEEAQGNRATWLSIQTVIKVAELFLVTQCLTVPQKVQKFFRHLCSTTQTKKQLSFVNSVPKRSQGSFENSCIVEPIGAKFPAENSTSDMVKAQDSLETALASNTPQHELNDSLEVTLGNTDPESTESSCQSDQCASIVPFHNNAVIEKEILPQASSNNVEKELKEESYNEPLLSDRLDYEFQDNQLLSSVFDELQFRFNHNLYMPSLMQSLSVEIVSAHAPLDTENLVGDVEIGMFDERGGVFHSHKHGATILLPAGAVPSGILAELKFAATLVAPVKLISNKIPVSAIYWLCMDVVLQKPIQVRLPHFVNNQTETQTSLKFLKSTHSPVDVTEEIIDNIIEGKFPTGESYGSMEADHFCYYCIVEDKLERNRIPCNRYVAVAMKQRQARNRLWSIHICILPLLKTCIEKLKEQYGYDWKYQSLREFSFPQGCEHVAIGFKTHPFQGEAVVEILNDDKINQRDIDFQHYYDKDESVLNQLRLLMDEKLYPPRFKAIVQARNKDFFESSNYLYYQLTCGTEVIKGKLVVPGRDTSIFTTSSSESDSSLKNKHGSGTSGYDSIEHLPVSDVDESNSEKLQLRNLMLQTMAIKSKWFELGMALYVPIDKLERLYDKYNDNPVKALVRVFRYWLADKNGLKPSWEKLIAALQDIKEYSLAIGLEKSTSDHPAVFHDDIEPEKELVMKHVRLELINLTALIPVLNKHNLLTLDDNYKLLDYSISPLERANALLYIIIPSKGPGAFKTFITCLQEETEHIGHQELAKMLTPPTKTTTRAMETAV